MRPRHLLLSLAIASANTTPATAKPYHYQLKTYNCSPAPAPLDASGKPDPEWLPFAPFIETCPVIGPTQKPALQILTIRRDLIEKTNTNDSVPDDLNQKILSPTGQYLGALIQTFPSSYPETISLSFEDWRNNQPQKIIENSADNLGLSAPGGDLTIFVWDTHKHTYIRQSPLPAYIKPNHN